MQQAVGSNGEILTACSYSGIEKYSKAFGRSNEPSSNNLVSKREKRKVFFWNATVESP